MKVLILFGLSTLLIAQASSASLKIDAIVGPIKTTDDVSLVTITNMAPRLTYVITNESFTQSGCTTYCNTKGWSLTGFKNKEEWDFIEGSFTANGHSGVPFWTSGFKYAGIWQWSGKGEITFFKWDTNANEPNSISANPSIYFYSDLGWYDGYGTEKYRCVCEFNF